MNSLITTTIAGLSVAGYMAYRGANEKWQQTSVFVEDIFQSDQRNSNQNYRGVTADGIADDETHERCVATVLPSFVNVSLTWTGSVFGEALKKLSPPSVMVIATGNTYPESIRLEKVKASQDFDAILVGSLAPDGRRSDFSNEQEEVHIIAPSDRYQSSADEDGNRRSFGGEPAEPLPW